MSAADRRRAALEAHAADGSRESPKADRRTPPLFESSQLFGDANEILIEHAGSHYRLRITRQGNLILNK